MGALLRVFCEILATYPWLIYPRLPHNAGLKARADKNGRLFAALEGALFHGDANRGEALAESPRRLPAQFANKLYKSGESGMGYTIFTVIFADGSRQAYGTGNAVDFISYPEGKGQMDVVDCAAPRGKALRTSGLSRVLLVPILRVRIS